MKPAPFEYFQPKSLEEAVELLQAHGEEAKILAGGQSLVPLMNLRLARPRVLIDINRVGELDYIRELDGGLAIGALTRQRDLETSDLVRRRCPLLKEATLLIGHPQVRNRGTVGGSLAHADSTAELSTVAVLLEADMIARSLGGERSIRAEDFFVTFLTTSLGPEEVLTEVRFPAVALGAGWAFEELSRRHGDFAIVSAAAILEKDPSGRCRKPRLAIAGASPQPVRAREAERLLVGQALNEALIQEAGELAKGAVDPESDLHASAEYRRHLAGVLTRRALQKTWSRAQGGP